MNAIQKKVFQLFKMFVQICDRLQMEYFMLCGSALGAIKYGGFIPWDDDIDVGLYREDYERFCKEAPMLLPKKFFLQKYASDPDFPAIYSKLRDSSTTSIEKSVAKLPINHGISIDIFPLDGYPKKKHEQHILEIKKRLFVKMLSIPCIRTEPWKELAVKPLRDIGFGKYTARIAARYTSLISAWPVRDSDIIANHGNWQGALEYHRKEIYGCGSMGEFEGENVRLPENSDLYLQQKYGNWHKEPPIEMQKSHHEYLIVDVDKPYTDFLNTKKIVD